MAVDTGFVVTSDKKISTQCDLVIYDTGVAPTLENAFRKRFYPVEVVCAVGEVKSVLDRRELRESLEKLVQVKKLKQSMQSPEFLRASRDKAPVFRPDDDELDQMMTFIVCERFDFPLEKLPAVLRGYSLGDGRTPALRHNFILSLEDGLLSYVQPKYDNILCQFPIRSTEVEDSETGDVIRIEGRKTKNRFIQCASSDEHLRIFVSMLHSALCKLSVFIPDMARYLSIEQDLVLHDFETQ